AHASRFDLGTSRAPADRLGPPPFTWQQDPCRRTPRRLAAKAAAANGSVGHRREDRGQRTEDRGQWTEDRGKRTEDSGQRRTSRKCGYLTLSSVLCSLFSPRVKIYLASLFPLGSVGLNRLPFWQSS